MSRISNLLEKIKKKRERVSSESDNLGKKYKIFDVENPSNPDLQKTQIIYKSSGVYVSLNYIETYKDVYKEVYFVSGDNGDEYGQYSKKSDALDKAKEMASLDKETRKQHDR